VKLQVTGVLKKPLVRRRNVRGGRTRLPGQVGGGGEVDQRTVSGHSTMHEIRGKGTPFSQEPGRKQKHTKNNVPIIRGGRLMAERHSAGSGPSFRKWGEITVFCDRGREERQTRGMEDSRRMLLMVSERSNHTQRLRIWERPLVQTGGGKSPM